MPTWTNRLSWTAVGFATLLSADIAMAADTHPAWIGILAVTANTSGCAGFGGVQPGDHAVMVYRPQFTTGDTATTSSLSVIYLRAAFDLVNGTSGQMNVSNGTYKGTLIDSKAKLVSFSGTYNITTAPAIVTPTTGEVTMSGTVTGIFGAPGCSVTFKSTLTPEN